MALNATNDASGRDLKVDSSSDISTSTGVPTDNDSAQSVARIFFAGEEAKVSSNK